MFRHLKLLDEASLAFRRQRDAIIERGLPLAARNRDHARANPRLALETDIDYSSWQAPILARIRATFRKTTWA